MVDAKRLKIAMVEVGITYADLAKKIGVSYTTLYRKITGATEFTLPELRSIVEALQLTEAEMHTIFFA